MRNRQKQLRGRGCSLSICAGCRRRMPRPTISFGFGLTDGLKLQCDRVYKPNYPQFAERDLTIYDKNPHNRLMVRGRLRRGQGAQIKDGVPTELVSGTGNPCSAGEGLGRISGHLIILMGNRGLLLAFTQQTRSLICDVWPWPGTGPDRGKKKVRVCGKILKFFLKTYSLQF